MADRADMRCVYTLARALKDDPGYVEAAQALTLNDEKPLLGLKGRFGLFGSDEWWTSIRTGRIKTMTCIGRIEHLFFAGQDSRWGDQVNSFELRLYDGSLVEEGIYSNNKQDRKLFKIGARVSATYAFDELKMQPASDGGVNCSRILLEMFVSTRAVLDSG